MAPSNRYGKLPAKRRTTPRQGLDRGNRSASLSGHRGAFTGLLKTREILQLGPIFRLTNENHAIGAVSGLAPSGTACRGAIWMTCAERRSIVSLPAMIVVSNTPSISSS